MPNKVVSKYFSNETGMDDSLSDFQEKKKYNTGPKNVKTTRNNKKPKRARGQKDIRTLIKKENDVLSYSKDFDKVCKEAGLDVDSEELQLAIALSKSLNDAKKENTSEIETKSTEDLTSRQRTLKIKTTLQEYGFRVPKTKITETNRRNKSKKQYKLLLVSDTERQQIISDKYSEVLAGNIFKLPAKVSDSNYSDKKLYYKATNIAYEHIKNDDIYYVKDLFDKSSHNICLLRDWSEIPGRPLSPKVEVNNINFDEIICDQHELDCILSGTIIAAQQIVTNKNYDLAHNSIFKTVQFKLDESQPLVNEADHNNAIGIELSKENITLIEVSCYTNSNTMSVSQARCISPDLFDDEVSVVTECPDTDVQLSGQTFSKSDNMHTYSMDLTECVNIDSYNSDLSAKTKLWTNNENNIPNRRSNDLMEITECVSTSSKQLNVEKVDLTQSSNEQTDDIISQNENNEVMVVTQVPDYNPLVEEIGKIEKNNFLDDTIIVVDDDLNSEQQLHKQKLSLRELPEPICIALNNIKSDFSSENAKDESHQRLSNRFKDHLLDKSDKSNCDYKKHTLKTIEKVAEHKNKLVECPVDSLDLTQSSNSSEGETLTNQHILNYSPSLGKRDNISIDYDEIDIVSVTSLKSDKVYKYENNSVEIEASESNNDVASNPNKSLGPVTFFENESNYSLLHSKHDTLVENGNYYEISDDIDSVPITSLRSNECHKYEINSIEKEANVSNKNIALNPNMSLEEFETFEKESNNSVLKSKRDKNGCPVKEAFNSNNDIAISPSKSSEVFEISDKEFNYSVHQSVYENFDFRDVSVVNDFSNYKNHSVGECSHYPTTKKRLLSESNLKRDNIISPQKEVSQSHKLHFNSETSNVIRMPQENTKNVLNTPKNGEYIIKTNDVTPMLDYASMSSPERHKELEKYGLKPFKRKRAIQLLTYMYNQTHPVVEMHDDGCPSPSKRLKRDDGDEKFISKKNTSKCESLASLTSKAPDKPIEIIPEVDKENNLYAVTTEQPDIRNIECGSEDWFFQKREKAKLYSCRVPLHVAFHNYVSCRRRLREAILRYEPVNIDVIHKELVAAGYRYNPKDLLKFMDRKCITVKTAENNLRNRKS